MTIKQIHGYKIMKYLGKGKSGYSYLVEKDHHEVVLKQIHHEQVDNYSFKNKLEHELEAYYTLEKMHIKIPKLLEINRQEEYIIKEYIEGDTLLTHIANNDIPKHLYYSFLSTAFYLEKEGINIDYFPNNFIVKDNELIYIDYEINEYSIPWDFLHWGIYMWFNVEGCNLYKNSDNNADLLVNEKGNSKVKCQNSEAFSFVETIQKLDLISTHRDCSNILDTPLYQIDIKPVSGGLAADSYQLKTPNHQYFLKVYGPSASLEDIQDEIDAYKHHYSFQAKLHQSVMNRDNNTSILLFDYVNGISLMEAYEKSEDKGAIIQRFTTEMIEYHKISSTDQTNQFIDQELSMLKQLNQTVSNKTIDLVINYLENNKDTVTQTNLVKIHGDYHPWNAMIDQDKLWIIDWKERFGDRRYDVYWTYELLLRSNYQSFAEAFISFYKEKIPSITQDKNYFIVLSNIRWLLNVIIDIEEKDKDFQTFIYSMLHSLITRIKSITNIELKIV